MFISKRIAACFVMAAFGACATQMIGPPALSQSPNLGRAANGEEIAAWDISVAPNGTGLPPGSGSVKQGAAIYAAKCQACHGANGAGKPVDALAGGMGTLASNNPVRTVGSYWPYATTLFDYVRRAMPSTAPGSLTNDEIYALSAYILSLDGIVPADAVMSAHTLPQVKMPNRDGFIDWSRKDWRAQ
jgi:S-disulfanyl-L-cysteine oxidoreductase SoxD